MRRIAYIVSRFPTVTETFVLYEMLELRRLGVDVRVFSLVHERNEALQPGAEELVRDARYFRLSWELVAAQLHWLLKRPGRYLSVWLATLRGNLRSPRFLSRAIVAVPAGALFSRQIQAFGAEHLHAHFATHPALVAYVVHRLTDLPYSITAHAHDIYADRAMLEEKLARSSLIVTISDFNRRLLHDLYGNAISRKTTVIHCGIDTELFQARPDAAPHPLFRILCVGSLRDYKGQSYLVKACALLRDERIGFECTFVGDGVDRAALEAEIRQLHLEDSVRILGYQTRDTVRDLLNRADVFVLPSVTTPSGKMEGIPVALMEALAMGVPAISTRISGIPELLIPGRTGFLVPERDVEALREALVQVCRDPRGARALARQGRERVVEEFDLRRNARRLYEAFGGLKDHPHAGTSPT